MRPEDVDAALVETACRARWDAQGSTFTGHYGDVARTWDALAALFPTEAENHRAVERHALAAVLPEIQAQALRDHRARAERFYADTTRVSKALVLGDLDDYAARLTTTTEEPTDA